MAKKHYGQLAEQVMELVGGKENVTYLAHCMTRLRFNLKDESLADVEKIKEIPGLLGSQWMNGQLQIIIGQDVTDVYDEILKRTGLNREDDISENLDGDVPKRKRTFGEKAGNVVSTIAGCVAPVILVLIAAGLLQSVVAILTSFCGVDSASSTIQVLNFVSNAAFYFMPVYVGSHAAKKFGASPCLGMLMGGMMLSPVYIAAIQEGTVFTFLGLPFKMTSYTNTVIPVILDCLILGYVERFFNKHLHTYIRAFMAPLLTVLVMIPVTFCAVGPLGAYLSTYVVDALVWFHEVTGPVGVGLVAMLYPLLVATGMHVGMSPIMVQTFATYGYENLFYPAGCIGNECQGFASMAVAFKTRNKEVKSIAISAGIPAVLGKVTEPALYGICLKYRIPEYCAMVGEFIGGVFAGIVGTKIYYFGGGGLLGFAGYIGGESPWELPLALAGIFLAGGITFILTYIFYSDEKCGVKAD